ncbi:MAG: hypothetical protein WCP23_01060 [Planctomycetota bacterium]
MTTMTATTAIIALIAPPNANDRGVQRVLLHRHADSQTGRQTLRPHCMVKPPPCALRAGLRDPSREE